MLLVALMLLLAACRNPLGSALGSATHKTVAQDGGLVYTLTMRCPSTLPQCDPGEAMHEMSVLLYRCQQGLGVSDAVVTQQGANTIIVDLPGFTDATRATALLTTPGALDFIDTNGVQLALGATPTLVIGATPAPGQYTVLFSDADLDTRSVQAEIDPQTNQPVVAFAFSGSSKGQFATYTREHIGQFLTITLDGVVIESAIIQSEIDGQGQITGIGTMAQAQNLAAELQSRALPVPVTLVSERQVKLS